MVFFFSFCTRRQNIPSLYLGACYYDLEFYFLLFFFEKTKHSKRLSRCDPRRLGSCLDRRLNYFVFSKKKTKKKMLLLKFGFFFSSKKTEQYKRLPRRDPRCLLLRFVYVLFFSRRHNSARIYLGMIPGAC